VQEEFLNTWKTKNNTIRFFNKKLNFEFWNLFSVNDYESAQQFIKFILDKHSPRHNYEIILNTRMDRPLRTKYFVSLISQYFKNTPIIVSGSGKLLAYKLLKQSNCKNTKILNNNRLQGLLSNTYPSFTTIIGLANYKGLENFIYNINSVLESEKV
jgi:hypothetical protein